MARTNGNLNTTSTTLYRERHAFYDGSPQIAVPRSSLIFESINPFDQRVLAEIHTSAKSTVDHAVASAKAAASGWAGTSAVERARILLKASQILRSRNDELAKIETHDTGKPFSETSTIDVTTGADVLEFFANLVASGGLNGETIRLRSTALIYTTKEPHGVCAGIGAWNYPLQIALWKSGPCLAAGNTMVYKPSEFTPLHAEVLADIYIEAGLPPGVFNVVYGAGETGAYLTTHPDIAKVSFTGQVTTGRKVAESAAGEMKYITMELGGKSPLIVLPDANLDQAVDGAMMANFFSSGQVCTNGTRVFVPENRVEEFERILLSKIRNIRAGDPLDEGTNFGPLVSKVHFEKVVAYIRHGIEADNATLLTAGTFSSLSKLQPGNWVEPTVFANCTDEMRIAREEIFGPVMCILTYNSDTEDYLARLIERANGTNLGLAAGVFGQNLDLCHNVIRDLEAGITWINTWGESPAEMAVGGWKQSGVGVENGRKGLDAWTRNKSTFVELSGQIQTAFTEVKSAI